MQITQHTGTNTHPASAGMTDKQLSNALANMYVQPDHIYFACPQKWRDLAALLHTLIEDEQLNTEQTALAAGVPVSVVAEYRTAVSI